MCGDPLTIGLTVAGAGLQVLSNYGANQTSSARNRQLGKQLKRQQLTVRGNTYRDRAATYLRGVDAKTFESAATIAASIAAGQQQLAIQQIISQALVNKQDNYVKAVTGKGLGRSLERGNRRSFNLAFAAAGRAEAADTAKLGRAVDKQRMALKDIYSRADTAIKNKYKAIGILPEGDTGYMPTMDDVTWDTGQSALTQIANIGMGALSGYQMGSSLAAPNAGSFGTSSNTSFASGMNMDLGLTNYQDYSHLLSRGRP